MSEITYTDQRNYTARQVEELFLSLGWVSGKYPERLKAALDGSHTVFCAWDGDTLVGLVNAISDGELTAYIHYLLVRPEYQSKGIGGRLIEMMSERYKGYLYLILAADSPKAEKFYEKHGYKRMDDSKLMAVYHP